MRASWFKLIPIALLWACGSSTASPPPANDASASGTGDGAIVLPDGHVMFNESGSKMLYPVGGICMRNSDCLSGNCNRDTDGFPMGYCVADCGVGRYGPQPCEPTASCTILNADTPTCYLTCSSAADCRSGYTCLNLGASLVTSGGQSVCYPTGLPPNCNFNSDCPPSMPHCTGGWFPPEAGAPSEAGAGEAGAGEGGASDSGGGGGDDGGPPQPGMGNCGP